MVHSPITLKGRETITFTLVCPICLLVPENTERNVVSQLAVSGIACGPNIQR